MADDMRTLGYICPKCGAQVMGARSVFALEASDAEIAPEATARPTSTTSSFVQSSRIPLTSRAELIYDWARKSGQKTVRTFLI